ncbi:MAG: alpha/beta fold hydrolase [Clostridia bacterium]|nr:alpha/beta fold hydrolase [Clostridia bacterium]
MIFSKQIAKMYSKTLFTRYDPDGSVFYFSHTDFEGLSAEPYEFKNQLGDTLVGAVYSYEGADESTLVVFDHGMGNGGHRAYMKEIEMLCSAGFSVLSYDHTGCARSEGKCIRGLSGSLADLDACIQSVKQSEKYSKRSLFVVGHSWGAFSTMNIASYHPDIKKIVAISGFISLRDMQKQILAGPLALWRKDLFELERRVNPDYVNATAPDALLKSDAQILLIYSADDKTVSAKRHHTPLVRALSERDNVEIMLLDECKGHNPNYTAEAVKYKGEFFVTMTEKKKRGELQTDEQKAAFVSSYDWHKMTEQDEKVWQKIISHLKK